MIWLYLLLLIILVCFSFVLLFGPPYLPTLTKQVDLALELADLQAGDTLLELGCGDGKVLLAAARCGLTVVGYELNPILVIISRLRTLKYREQVTVVWGNFLTHSWPDAQAIFIFGLGRIMPQVDKKIMQFQYRPVKLVSFAFQLPGRKATKHQQGLYLYKFND